MYKYICMCMCICMCTHTYVHTYIYIYTQICVHMHLLMCLCTYKALTSPCLEIPRLLGAARRLVPTVLQSELDLRRHELMPRIRGLSYPKGSSTQCLRTPVSKTMHFMVFGTRVLKYWVLGPPRIVDRTRCPRSGPCGA